MRRWISYAAAALAVCATGLAWWALQPTESPALSTGTRGGTTPRVAGGAPTASQAGEQVARPSSPGTEGDAFLTADLRHTLEDMLLEAGEVADPTALKHKLAQIAARRFPGAGLARRVALAERYVDYRVALGHLAPPSDLGDPRALRAALDARQQVRRRHFSPEEYDALFADEAQLDRFTVARIEIERHPGLIAVQKQAALRDAERELSQEQRALRTDAVSHVAVAAQTAAFDARNASDQERYAQRTAQYGNAAAQQLAQLDREERDWQSRLSDYAAAQARQSTPAQLQQMRQQLFSPQEQLRLEAALHLRQAAASPAQP